MPRGRPKSKPAIQEISEQDVWDVLTFARNMDQSYNGIYTPDLVNARMKDINLNPLSATESEIEKALKNPKDSERELIGFSEFFELIDMLYKRQIMYLGNLLSWDYTFECINASDKDFTSPSYQKDEKIFEEFMEKFNVKKEFKQIAKNIIRRESFFGVLREEGEQYTIQELPQQYCKITGRFEYGLLFDFDYMWFLSNAGVDINCYPISMRKAFNELMKNKNSNGYLPSSSYNNRDGEWVYWKQCSPEDGFWCFKFNPETATNVPFFSPMFSDLILKPMIRNLQKNKYIIEASKILIGLIGFNKENKSGQVRDAFNIDPTTAGKFASLIRQGLSKEIQFGIAPFSEVKSFEWKSDGHNLLDEYTKVTVAGSGNNSRLLYMTDKSNAEESKSSLAIDEQLVTYIYPFFEDFINYHVNRKTKKYKFKIHFQGTEMPQNRKQRLDNAKELAQMGIVLPHDFAASLGKSPFQFERELAMARSKGFVDKLTPIIMASQMSGKENGRPETDDPTDSTIATQDTGANVARGGKI